MDGQHDISSMTSEQYEEWKKLLIKDKNPQTQNYLNQEHSLWRRFADIYKSKGSSEHTEKE